MKVAANMVMMIFMTFEQSHKCPPRQELPVLA